ncbi:ABC transporter substrate-binding protein [Microlunatus sp. Gsoil 973]|uniref:ABC transporter substrate-binding protein n=1 Tax=Microlunatus sp. Gsoil 973 TaxID=2672569 RepID=UPI0018A7F0B4|nr:sugar ABC transporter substrate-binding protein [Microlunatus sp. Gsoil 973]
MRRRTLLAGLGSAVLIPPSALALAGCSDDSGSSGFTAGGDGKPGANASGSKVTGTVNFLFYGDAAGVKDYQNLFTKFAAFAPGITVKVTGIAAKTWADFANQVSTRLAGGQTIDVIQIATEGQAIFASKNLLEPLDPYIQKDQAYVDEYYKDNPPKFKDWMQQHASPDGKTYFIPGSYNTMALYVSGKIFEKAGVEVPTEWTWDEFLQIGKTIKEKTGAYFHAAGAGQFTDVMTWLTNNGASILNEDWTQPTLNTPQAIEALTFAKSLVDLGLSPKPGGTYDAPTLMAQGKLATFGGGRWPTPPLRKLKAIEGVQMVPWPKKATAGSPIGWDAWPILKESKNKDAAWELIKYFMTPDYGKLFAVNGGAVPGRISVANSTAFTNDAPANMPLLVKLADIATPVPGIARGAEAQTAVEQAWLQGISGTTDPAKALGTAQTKLQGLMGS